MSKASPRPQTAKALQLYTAMTGVNAVAREIAKALSNARRAFRKAIPTNYPLVDEHAVLQFQRDAGKALREACETYLWPVLNAYADYGATDTEPRAVCREWLVHDIKERHGFDPDEYLELF